MVGHEATLDAPAADAWAVVAGYRRDVQWRHGVRSMVAAPDGTVRPGTRTRQVLRAAGRTTGNDGGRRRRGVPRGGPAR
ncbi:hypothetical protein [Pseudonocardia spirodelae]|uniref:Uncharacterized protein n=1 Tax=Pseudonocardia spirodelae TaxID=3133431 RepID=A0ABU8T318_9PSEU